MWDIKSNFKQIHVVSYPCSKNGPTIKKLKKEEEAINHWISPLENIVLLFIHVNIYDSR